MKPTLYNKEKAMAFEIEVCPTWKEAGRMIVYVLEHATFHEFRQQAIDAMNDMAGLADDQVEMLKEEDAKLPNLLMKLDPVVCHMRKGDLHMAPNVYKAVAAVLDEAGFDGFSQQKTK